MVTAESNPDGGLWSRLFEKKPDLNSELQQAEENLKGEDLFAFRDFCYFLEEVKKGNLVQFSLTQNRAGDEFQEPLPSKAIYEFLQVLSPQFPLDYFQDFLDARSWGNITGPIVMKGPFSTRVKGVVIVCKAIMDDRDRWDYSRTVDFWVVKKESDDRGFGLRR